MFFLSSNTTIIVFISENIRNIEIDFKKQRRIMPKHNTFDNVPIILVMYMYAPKNTQMTSVFHQQKKIQF